MTPVYIVDESSTDFESARLNVDVVCAGDSLTGWNNYGPAQYWPFPTYPRFLQEKCESLDLQVADGGIAGEISDNGRQFECRLIPFMVEGCLSLTISFGFQIQVLVAIVASAGLKDLETTPAEQSCQRCEAEVVALLVVNTPGL